LVGGVGAAYIGGLRGRQGKAAAGHGVTSSGPLAPADAHG